MIYLKNAASAFKNALAWRDILMMVGLSLIAYGVSLVNVPAAFVVPGAILVAVSVFGVK